MCADNGHMGDGSVHRQHGLSAKLFATTAALAAALLVPAWSQDVGPQGAAAPAVTLEDALHRLYEQAEVVFTGEVLSIDRQADGVVVRWEVNDAVRGTDTGAVYTLREWPGLWASGEPRYTVGQRALVLLHRPSAAGYTSAVGGSDGIIPLRGSRGNQILDVRLLAQRVVVTDAARLRPMQMLHASRTSVEGGGSASVSTAAASDHNGSMDGAVVLSMLHAWQQARVAAR